MRKLLVTGAAGFIGSHFVRRWLGNYPEDQIVVLDALTYAGNLNNLPNAGTGLRLKTIVAHVQDELAVDEICSTIKPSHIVNFAAESHNDRAMMHAGSFVDTNVAGVAVLARAALKHGARRLLHVSTDEVYGQTAVGRFKEDDRLDPRTPYAASKSAGELMLRSYGTAHGLDFVITRGGNTIGPNQYPEKIVPLFAVRAISGRKLPVYGQGAQVREYIYVDDHCSGIETALLHGSPGAAYNVGAGNERSNIDVTRRILNLTGRTDELILFIPDPRGAAHDVRYALDCTALHALGWTPATDFDTAIARTVDWYVGNSDWWRPIVSDPDYNAFIKAWYGKHMGDNL